MTRHDRAVSLVVDGDVLPGIHERASDFRQLPLQFARRHFRMVSKYAYCVKLSRLTAAASNLTLRSLFCTLTWVTDVNMDSKYAQP